jgi:hypothetical protein
VSERVYTVKCIDLFRFLEAVKPLEESDDYKIKSLFYETFALRGCGLAPHLKEEREKSVNRFRLTGRIPIPHPKPGIS